MNRLLVMLVVVCISTLSFATIRTVNNSAATPAAYQTLQAAHDAASSGDTIYVVGSPTSYGTLTTTKRLVWIGPGYFLGVNSETQVNPNGAKLNTLVVNTGSENSVFSGLSLEGQVTIASNYIVVRRCYLYRTDAPFFSVSSMQYIVIEQCYFYGTFWQDSPLVSLNASRDVIVKNSVIYSVLGPNAKSIMGNSSSGAITVANNILTGTLDISNGNVYNNILRSGSFTVNNNTYNNNIGNSTQFGTANGNQSNVNVTNLFVGSATTSSDGFWQLATGSAAIGTGMNGTDCGIFGGPEPYVLSGLPSVPSIYYFSAPLTGAAPNGLSVTIRAKAH